MQKLSCIVITFGCKDTDVQWPRSQHYYLCPPEKYIYNNITADRARPRKMILLFSEDCRCIIFHERYLWWDFYYKCVQCLYPLFIAAELFDTFTSFCHRYLLLIFVISWLIYVWSNNLCNSFIFLSTKTLSTYRSFLWIEILND